MNAALLILLALALVASLALEVLRARKEASAKALLAELRVQCKVSAMRTALDLTAILAATERQAIQAAPLSSARFKRIVDDFVVRTANEISRWPS